MKRKLSTYLQRREFVALLPACLVPVRLFGKAAGPRRGTTAAPPALGYLHGSETIADLAETAAELERDCSRACWIPATALRGDPSFERTGVTVTFRGARPAEEYATAVSGVKAFSVGVDCRPFHDARIKAWSFDNKRVSNVSRANTLHLPVHPDRGLQLSFSVEGSGNRERFSTRLGVGSGRGPRLRRGVYCIAADGKPQTILVVEPGTC
jgi:hypothetical protein